MKEGKTRLTGVALIAALIVLAVWLALLMWLMLRTDASEVVWARLFAVLGSLEAVAFAAAGALFGTTIQRQRVRDAQQQAEKAEERATKSEENSAENAQMAANGRALATAVKTRMQARSSDSGVERLSVGERAASAADDDLAALANRLFPD